MNKIMIFMLATMLLIPGVIVGQGLEIGGDFAATAIVDGDDFNLSTTYLGVSADSKNVGMYGVYDLETDMHDILEAHVKFNLFDSYSVKAGRVAIPYGLMYLDRPSTSVFVSSPKIDTYTEGVVVTLQDDVMQFDGFYGHSDEWAFTTQMSVANGGWIPGFSYDSEERFTMFQTFTYETLFMNVSNLTEWNLSDETFWTRFVVTPGILGPVGLMGSYYNVDTGDLGLQDFNFMPDAFTVGAFIDIDGVTFSTEWKLDEDMTPVAIQASTTF